MLTNERKFVALNHKLDYALAIFHQHCLLDPTYPLDTIHSIYYDTPRLSSYWEKIEGDHIKRKVRLRWYGNTASDQISRKAYIEIKYRIGSARDKVRHSLDIDYDWFPAAPLHDPRYVQLLYDEARSANLPIPPDLFPVIQISYHRWRFICPVTLMRVCVDIDIVASRTNRDFLPGFSYVLANIPIVVCEFKSQGLIELPWVKDLYDAGFRLRSFSKYGDCMNFILMGGVH
ncbi:VTC domain-containing protein [Desulfonatronum thiodismutans]|uniref:VTC domain-containing protein n=1 Tax=Desulfonatronum thiodismutans TaxID=159290 RepID=UPI0009FF3341|nr:VTC domain-containing protein [Desulfonatronum thiodismutans]